MSCKLSMNNSIKLNSGEQQQWVKTASVESNVVKLAGEEAKDRLYEPKHKKKLVRVLTVVAYVFFVSLAAIMLSLYYVFLWHGNQKDQTTKTRLSLEPQISCNNGENVLVDVPFEPTAIPVVEQTTSTTDSYMENSEDDDISWRENDYNNTKLLQLTNPILKKLIPKHLII